MKGKRRAGEWGGSERGKEVVKIDRLIGIIMELLRNEKVTAPYLAERFEVSRRTINRDIEDICRAGIPVVTRPGFEGGISIAKGYKIDHRVLTEPELRAILIGLKSVESVSGVSCTDRISEKLAADAAAASHAADRMRIDLSTYYKASLVPKIEMLQAAIEEKRLVSFRYYYAKGESDRTIEPYRLLFQWASWYVLGYCLRRSDFRMFKLNRLTELRLEDERFSGREAPELKPASQAYTEEEKPMTVLFEPEVKYRLVEEYGPDSFAERSDGKLKFDFSYGNEDEMVRWILSFGSSAEVLQPAELAARIRIEAQGILQKYKK
ncbi:helix-turn-helix transcriptional regulator [Bacilliculturomica massiliensis]|uniref:helix-turn-helix transcriptional regulator n=1 Tax=Bacilliculturomica massiliensis TaxID=1917867 RepID=UPI001FE24C78|nr:YafY family protein [Bacilliculturomica massiliensis]